MDLCYGKEFPEARWSKAIRVLQFSSPVPLGSGTGGRSSREVPTTRVKVMGQFGGIP